MAGKVTLSGTMIDPLSNPVSGADIILKSVKNGDVISGVSAKFTTSTSGGYSVSVPPGSYKVFVMVSGQETALPGYLNVFDYSGSGTLEEYLSLPSQDNDTPAFYLAMYMLNKEMRGIIDNAINNYYQYGGFFAFKDYASLSAFKPESANTIAKDTSTGTEYIWDGSSWSESAYQSNNEIARLNRYASSLLTAIGVTNNSVNNLMLNVNSNSDDVAAFIKRHDSEYNAQSMKILIAISMIENSLNSVFLSANESSERLDKVEPIVSDSVHSIEEGKNNYLASISIIASSLQSVISMIDSSYTTKEESGKTALSFLVFCSRLLTSLSGLEGFDPKTVLTKADLGDITSGTPERYKDSYQLPKPSSIVRIDITADSIPSDKTADDVNATVVITADGAVFSTKAKLSVQGATSAAYPKKNLSMDLYTSDFSDSVELKIGDTLPHDTWVFKANWVDSTQIRNLMSYRLWQEFQASRNGYPKFDIDNSYVGKNGEDGFITGATAVPVGYPCVTYINDEFYGVGTIAIGKKHANYNIPKNKPTKIQGDIGNWILLTDTLSSVNNGTIEFKAPKTVTDATKSCFSNWDKFANLTGDDFTKALPAHTDKNNLIDFYLFVTLIAAADLINNGENNQMKNVQFVTWDGVKFFFMPYDLDTVFGNNWAGGYSYAPEASIPWCIGSFWDSVVSAYGDDIKARYKDLRSKGVISVDTIYRLSTDIALKYNKDLLSAEFKKWGATDPALPSTDRNGRDQIIDWSTKRISALDSHYSYQE